MAHQSNKWQKNANQGGGYGVPNEYAHYVVGKPAPLLEWLLENIKGESKTKIKLTLQGRGIKGMVRLSRSLIMRCVQV